MYFIRMQTSHETTRKRKSEEEPQDVVYEMRKYLLALLINFRLGDVFNDVHFRVIFRAVNTDITLQLMSVR